MTLSRSRKTFVDSTMPANLSLNRTRHGMPPLGLISFWPSGITPRRAG